MRSPNLDKMLRAAGPFDPADMPLSEARRILADAFMEDHGYASRPDLLTHPEGQTKLAKSERYSVGLSLAAADMSGFDVCTWRTPECTLACVMTTAGRGKFQNTKDSRVAKTRVLAAHPQAFITVLFHEIKRTVAKVGPIDFRPNMASDLRWEHIAPALLSIPDVRVYDYTKAPSAHREPTDNYRLVFSVSEKETSVAQALEYLQSGNTAAVVFATPRGEALPATWEGFAVIDGDKSDSRVDDPTGVVVGLRAKGSAVGSSSDFVKPNVAS